MHTYDAFRWTCLATSLLALVALPLLLLAVLRSRTIRKNTGKSIFRNSERPQGLSQEMSCFNVVALLSSDELKNRDAQSAFAELCFSRWMTKNYWECFKPIAWLADCLILVQEVRKHGMQSFTRLWHSLPAFSLDWHWLALSWVLLPMSKVSSLLDAAQTDVSLSVCSSVSNNFISQASNWPRLQKLAARLQCWCFSKIYLMHCVYHFARHDPVLTDSRSNHSG